MSSLTRWERRKQRREKRKRPRIEVIHEAQFGLCYLCSKEIPHPRKEWVHHSDKASLDHVVPKNADDPERSCRHIRKNALVSHHGCNNRKANRMPHPCELLYLEAVNERLLFMRVRSRRY